jgi:2-polyprenyl-3-methyl-5-hydroxy-6-metoxy-1,4-benzoquinol methylase
VGEDRAFSAWVDQAVGPVVGYRGGSAGSAGSAATQRYVDFESTFRGPEERVAEIQRAYVPLLEGHAPVLDLGCGRGELLDLLREAGVSASGVDIDAGMVEHARAKGHEVELADGVDHLRALGEGALGALVAIEVIEHLPYERLIELLELAGSRLRDGGLLLLETVNPHAIAAVKAFWVDPTHRHPIFPETALELCRVVGFSEAYWFYPTGTGSFESDRNSEPIYAIAARVAP